MIPLCVMGPGAMEPRVISERKKEKNYTRLGCLSYREKRGEREISINVREAITLHHLL